MNGIFAICRLIEDNAAEIKELEERYHDATNELRDKEEEIKVVYDISYLFRFYAELYIKSVYHHIFVLIYLCLCEGSGR